jgi:hypothetical protein
MDGFDQFGAIVWIGDGHAAAIVQFAERSANAAATFCIS